MARAILKITLIILIAAFGVAMAVRALPRDDAAMRAFFAPDGDCELPCWFGIRPGETRLEDAVAILKAHPWVGRQMVDADISSPERAGALWWEWNGSQPAYIDGTREGRLAMRGNVVQYIVLPTTIPMGDVQAVFGVPLRGMVSRAQEYPGFVYHYAVYGGVQARTAVACPVWVADVWDAPAQINLTPQVNAAAFGAYDLIDWLREPPC